MCVRVCLVDYKYLCDSVSVCACVCLCEIQSKAGEGSSRRSTFYLTLCETVDNRQKRNGNPQVTDIRTVKNLPEDLTFTGCVKAS